MLRYLHWMYFHNKEKGGNFKMMVFGTVSINVHKALAKKRLPPNVVIKPSKRLHQMVSYKQELETIYRFQIHERKNDKMQKRKEALINVIATMSIILGVLLFFTTYCSVDRKQKKEASVTSIVVKNLNERDTVLCYLTLGNKKGFKANVNGIFGISNDKNYLQGSFYLAPNDSVVYTGHKGIPIQGNVSFWIPPSNCQPVNLFEFCLNNKKTVKNAQETVDISCMSGVNGYGSIELVGGGKWTDNYKDNNVCIISKQSTYNNNSISGVYPYGCPYCVKNMDAPDCIKKPSKPNKHNICQVQRNAKYSGGTVCINYIGKSN